jgi:hypothetical protein
MIELPQQKADVLVRVPLPHADINEMDLSKTKSEFAQLGISISLRTEENYPVSDSWAEIAILAGTFLGGAAAGHYADKLFDALDRLLKKSFGKVMLGISHRGQLTYHSIDRKDRAAAIALIRKALEELEKNDNDSA